MKKLILVFITLGLLAINGCAGIGGASEGVNLQGQEFSNLNES